MEANWFTFKKEHPDECPFVLELRDDQVLTARARKDPSGGWWIEAVLIPRHNLQKDEFVVHTTDYQIARGLQISKYVESLQEVPKVFAEATIPMKIVKKLYGKVFYPEWTGWENRESRYYVLEPIEKEENPEIEEACFIWWLNDFKDTFIDDVTNTVKGRYTKRQILSTVDKIFNMPQIREKLHKKYLKVKEKRAKELEKVKPDIHPEIANRYKQEDIQKFYEHAISIFKEHPGVSLVVLDPKYKEINLIGHVGHIYRTKQIVEGAEEVWIKLIEYEIEGTLTSEIFKRDFIIQIKPPEKMENPETEKEKDFTWWKRDFKAEFISDVVEALEGRYTWEQISPIVDEIFNKPKIREKLYQKYLKLTYSPH